VGKFGFNYITDEAREQLEKDGFRAVREKTSDAFQWVIYTDQIDFIEDDLRNRWMEPDSVEYAETKQRRFSQAMRHWYCKDTKTYYYLIGEKVYKSYIKREVQEITPSGNVTRHVWTLFDLEEEPGSIEDILRARRPSYDVRHTLF
jgi:hypothetical protein